jgi:translation initiation factor IF-1
MIASPSAYLVQFGRSGGLGCFTSAEPLRLRRGDRVLVETFRGQEVGVVVRTASDAQARLLGGAPSGTIHRTITEDDGRRLRELEERSRVLFEECRTRGHVLDVEMLFTGDRVIVHYAGAEPDLSDIERRFGVSILFENVNPPVIEAKGCGKPDCGRGHEGSCSSCGTEGGCGTCGSHRGVDLRSYFTHLRAEMEAQGRVPLL